MPELAEVEFYRKQWSPGLGGKILAVEVHANKKVFRGTDASALSKTLTCSTLLESRTHGKQLLFRFSRGGWVGIHLGMTGELRVEPPDVAAGKHDHLVLRQKKRSLVFSDPRQFGRVLFYQGKTEPRWWSHRPVEVTSKQFTREHVGHFLHRHGRAPIKAVLLLQNGFPGIGNWMADEILWQSHIHPARRAGTLRPREIATLHSKVQSVSRTALRMIGKKLDDVPKTWLFDSRWKAGERCPRDRTPLRRGTVGGRTTCWCANCQRPGNGVK